MQYHVGLGCSFGFSNHSVHQVIAEKKKATFINLSDGGKGNFRIYVELLQWVAANTSILQDTTVSIGWSGIWRNDVIRDASKFTKNVKLDTSYLWHTWRADRSNKTLKNMPTEMDIDLDHLVRYYSLVIGAQNLLKNLGVKYIMYNALDPNMSEHSLKSWKKLRVKTLKQQIDMTKFFKFDDSHSNFIAEHRYFLDPSPASFWKKTMHKFKKSNQTDMRMDFEVNDAHPSPEGNRKWAELMWEYITQNQVL